MSSSLNTQKLKIQGKYQIIVEESYEGASLPDYFLVETGEDVIDFYMSREETIAIRDALNKYLESMGEVISAPTSTDPELELEFKF